MVCSGETPWPMGNSVRASGQSTRPGRNGDRRLMLGAYALLFIMGCVAADITGAVAEEESPPPDSVAFRVLTLSVDRARGVYVLSVHGEDASLQTLSGEDLGNAHLQVTRVLPTDMNCRVEPRITSGSMWTDVVQQPTPDNDFEYRIRLQSLWGEEGGSFSLDVYALPFTRVVHPYDVVIITIDTLRADRVGCYGYARNVTPRLDAFAQHCVRFSNAFSASNITPPSHASLFTSKYVYAHGLLTWNALPTENETLAETLTGARYDGVASVNWERLANQGLDQGFERVSEGFRDGRVIVDEGLAAMRNARSPLFLWMHLFDVHRAYCRQNASAWMHLFNTEGDPVIGSIEDHYNMRPEDVQHLHLSEADLQFIADRFDAGIAYTDSQLGPLLDELSTPERRADTLVIITADHGESLLERRDCLFTHDAFLFGETTHVPLLIRLPGGAHAGMVIDELVSLIDVAPTVLEILGIPAPDGYQGRSLVPLLNGEDWDRKAVLLESWMGQLKAIRSKEWLGIRDLESDQRSLYDLLQDPMETRPLGFEPSAFQGLDQSMENLREFLAAPDPKAEPVPLSSEVRQHMESLGYLHD